MVARRRKMFLLPLMLAALLDSRTRAARILAVMPNAAPSHHIALCGVTRALQDAGHHVTYISGLDDADIDSGIIPDGHKVVHVGHEINDDLKEKALRLIVQDSSILDKIPLLWHFTGFNARMINRTLSHPAYVAEVNRHGQHYDLIIAELFGDLEAFIGLSYQFSAPMIAFHSYAPTIPLHFAMGIPYNPAWVPEYRLSFTSRMTFSERATNSLWSTIHFAWNRLGNLPAQRELLRKFWPDAPPLEELMHSKVAMSFINRHFSLTYPLALPPGVVEVGGIHIPREELPLPKELQEFLDSAPDGVIYFSMGSALRPSYMPEFKVNAILRELGNLQERVLAKWDGPVPANLSSNIRLTKWVPQTAVLAHRNVRAIFMHGGLQTLQEAAHYGVPVVAMPISFDHFANSRLAEELGFCIVIDFQTFDQEMLHNALADVLHNPRYRHAVVRASRRFRSGVVPPDRLVTWAVEHVLQLGGDHLRPTSVDLALHELLLLDVLVVAVLIVILAVLCVRTSLRALAAAAKWMRSRREDVGGRVKVD